MWQKGNMFSPKSPVEVVWLGFDLRAVIKGNDKINLASICVTATPTSVIPSTLTLDGDPQIVDSGIVATNPLELNASYIGKAIVQKVTGGVVGAYYNLSVTGRTDKGQVIQEISTIHIVWRGC